MRWNKRERRMAVYKRRYAAYLGSLTPEWSRFFVLTRYAFVELFKSRFFVILLILSFVPCLFFAGYLFIANNKTVQLLLPMGPADMFAVESRFFTIIMVVQTQVAFLLNCWVGPVLIAGDLTNGALPLFLSRPFKRSDYVLGKLSVLVLLTVGGYLGSHLVVVQPAGRPGQEWLDLVVPVDDRSYRAVLRNMDPDAVSSLS